MHLNPANKVFICGRNEPVSPWNTWKWKMKKSKASQNKVEASYFWLVGQTVQSRQLGQLGEAAVIDTEVQVLVQDTEILIAALHNPTATLQIDDSLHLVIHTSEKTSQRCSHVRRRRGGATISAGGKWVGFTSVENQTVVLATYYCNGFVIFSIQHTLNF